MCNQWLSAYDGQRLRLEPESQCSVLSNAFDMFSCSLPDREDVSTDYPQRLCFRALTGNLQLLVLKRVKNLRILLPNFACTFKIPYGYNSDTHFLFYTTSSNLEFSVREKFIIGRVTVVIYSVSQKKSPLRPTVFWHFWHTDQNFKSVFYTPIIHSYQIFIQLSQTLTKRSYAILSATAELT